MYKITSFSSQHIPQLLAIAPKFVAFYQHIECNIEAIESVLQHVEKHGVGFVAVKDKNIVGFIFGLKVPMLWTGETILQELAWWVEEEERTGSLGLHLLKTFEKEAQGMKVVMSILPKTPVKETTMNRLGYIKTEESYVRV